MFFHVEEDLFPTVYFLWQYHAMIPVLFTHRPVISKLSAGAGNKAYIFISNNSLFQLFFILTISLLISLWLILLTLLLLSEFFATWSNIECWMVFGKISIFLHFKWNQCHSSSDDCARELFKGLNRSASHLVCTRKKISWLGVADFLWVTS